MDIPIPPQKEKSVYDYGFDAGLNRAIPDNSTGVVYDTVNNTTNAGSVLSGGNLSLKTLSIGGLVRQVAPGDDLPGALEAVGREGGGTVQLLAGQYSLTQTLSIPSSVALIGAGAGVTILDFNNTTAQLKTKDVTLYSAAGGRTISISSGSKTVTGSGTSFTTAFQHNKDKTAIYIPETSQWYTIASVTSDTVLVLEDEYNGDALSGAVGWHIGEPVRNFVVEDITFRNNATNDLVRIQNAHIGRVSRCVFFDAGDSGVEIRSSDTIQVEQCQFSENDSIGLFAISSSIVTVNDCIFTNNYEALALSACLDVAINNCKSYGSSSYGIEELSGNRITISGFLSEKDYAGMTTSGVFVTVQNSTFNESTNGQGIFISGDNVNIVGCRITDNWLDGIYLDTTASRCVISGCRIAGNGVSAGAPVYLSAGITDCVVTGNSGGATDENDTDTVVLANQNAVSLRGVRDVITMQNLSGSNIYSGNPVAFSVTALGNPILVAPTAINGDNKVLGVAQKTTANTGTLPIIREGYVSNLWVSNGTSSIAIGDWLSTYSHAYYAKKAVTGDTVFAVALQAPTTSTATIGAALVSPRLI